MAEKKKTGKSSTGRSGGKTSSAPRRGSASKAGSGSRSKGEAASGPRPRKGFWGVVLLALGVFMLISYFSSRGDAQSEGKVVAFFANVIKGLVGWGFWLTVPAFLFAGFLLLAGKDKPVGRRAVCALLLPLVFSALAEVLVESQDALTGMYIGRSARYAPDNVDGSVRFRCDKALQPGEFVNVRFTRVSRHNLIGVCEED